MEGEMKQMRLKLGEWNRRVVGVKCASGLLWSLVAASIFWVWFLSKWAVPVTLYMFCLGVVAEQSLSQGLLQEQQWVPAGGGRQEVRRGSERKWKSAGRGKKRKTSNIRFILEGRILLLTHHAASVAMVTTGNNFCLLSPSLYPLNCVYLYFYSLHLGLTAGDGWKTSDTMDTKKECRSVLGWN